MHIKYTLFKLSTPFPKIWRQRWYYLDTKRNPCGLIELFPHYVVVHKEAAAYVKIAAAG